jgi:hypothetical protein
LSKTKTGNRGAGAYFTESDVAASWFSKLKSQSDFMRTDEFRNGMGDASLGRFKPNVMEFFVPSGAKIKVLKTLPQQNAETVIEQLKKEGYDGVKFTDDVLDTIEGQPELAKAFLNGKHPDTTIMFDTSLLKTRSQLTEIWKKAHPESNFSPGRLLQKEGAFGNPLIQEAKKYKTPEEFVKAQPVVYRGSKDGAIYDAAKVGKEGVFVSPSENIAGSFGKGFGKGAEPLYISPNAKVLEWKDVPEKFKNYDGKDIAKVQEELATYAKSNGYDVVYYEPKPEYPGGIEHQVVNPDIIKTKSKLTDIWKKAHPESNFSPPAVSLSQAIASLSKFR